MISHSCPTLDESDHVAVRDVICSGYIAQGNKVKEFEKKLAMYIGVQGGVAVSSGTSALHLALLGLGIKERDEVILPTYVCTAPLNAIYYIGAKPVIVDIEEETFNLSVREVKNKITPKTKAIIVPHMFGVPADMDEILNIGVSVIEDCAHSIGATYNGQMVGSIGTISIFSFYATKMLTTGEGGMVLSNDKKLLSKIIDIRDYDEREKFKVRFNYKITDIEAAIGLNQLNKLPLFLNRRREIAKKYNKAFASVILSRAKNPKVKPPFAIPSVRGSVFYRYVIRAKGEANSYIKELLKNGIECKKPIYKPLHQYLGLNGFPVADRVYKSAISIPIYPSLTDDEVNFIIETVTRIMSF